MNYLAQLLQNLAVEKAMYDLNLEEAVHLLMDGLKCDREVALSIISNKKSLSGEDDIILVNRVELSKEDAESLTELDPYIVIRKMAQELSGEIQLGDYWKGIGWVHLTISDIERHIMSNKRFSFDTNSPFDGIKCESTVYVDACDIVLDLQKYLDFQNEHDMFCNGELERFLYFLNRVREFKDKKKRYIEMIEFCRSLRNISEDQRRFYHSFKEEIMWFGGLWDQFIDMADKYKYGVSGNSSVPQLNSDLEAHLEGNRNLKTLENDFKEADIQDKYDAGWISPNGKFYGINGVVSNMLHMNLADIIVREVFGLEYCEDPELDLENKNWVKITGNWVLFAGYNKMIPVKLTNDQKDKIIMLGKAYDGTVLLGWDKHPVKVEDFVLMTDEQIEKMFEL